MIGRRGTNFTNRCSKSLYSANLCCQIRYVANFGTIVITITSPASSLRHRHHHYVIVITITPPSSSLRHRHHHHPLLCLFIFFVNTGALIVSIEHRFYGQSVPGGNLDTDNLKYLSSTQAYTFLSTFFVP